MVKSKRPKVSVIVPIYNVEKYLEECLNSIIHQTFKNLEIILINDGSTDDSLKICLNFKKKDPRINLINQINGGLSDARNRGLKHITGEYVVFIDSDDVIARNMIEILITTLQKNKCDIVECNFKKFRYQDEILETEDVLNQKEFAAEDAIENLITGNLKQVVWNKIYSKRILTEEFVTGRINEDEFWTYKILGNITSLIKIDKVLYFYRQQDNSIMNQKFNVKRLDGLIALEERISYLKEHYPKLEHLAIKHFCFQSMYIFQKLNKIEKIQKKKSLLLEIHANMTKYQFKKFHQSLTLKSLIWIKAFCSFPFFVSRIRNRFNIGV